MRTCVHFFFGFLFLTGLATALRGQSATYRIYDSIPQLEARIKQSSGTTLVVNFWATWCGPCVAELPYFEQLQSRYSGKVEVLLVSLDFKSQATQKLNPFLDEKKLKSEVCLLADQDADTWIPRVHQNWDGAIPFTLVIKGDKKEVHHERFKNFEDLEGFVRPFIDSSALNTTASSR